MQYLWRWALAVLTAGVAAHAATNDIRIECVPGAMKYDKEAFDADPGDLIRLTLTNADKVIHNLVLCTPGKGVGVAVAYKARALGEAAEARGFIPDDPAVLYHTRLLQPGQAETITFTCPSLLGDYAYVSTVPEQVATMRGVMRVGGPTPVLSKTVYSVYAGHWTNLPDFTTLRPVKVMPLGAQPLNLDVADRRSDFAMQFVGELGAPKDGEYTFHLDADDGARAYVDGKLVVDDGGSHAFGSERTGAITLARGYHEFRLQYFQSGGPRRLRASWSGPGFARRELATDPDEPTDPARLRPAPSKAQPTPLIVRAFVEDGPTRGVCVALLEGMNYCFDAETCALRFGWKGGFLDLGPEIGYRLSDPGGRPVKVLGERFNLGAECPIHLRAPTVVSPVTFLGYRRNGMAAPTLHYQVGKVDVFETVNALPQGDGFRCSFYLGPSSAKVWCVLKPEGFVVSSPQGEFSNGILELTGKAERSFEVTLRRQ